MGTNIDLSAVTVLCGSAELIPYKPLAPFAPAVLDFLADVGSDLMKEPEARSYPDVITFGFFCRKANLSNLTKDYEGKLEGRVGRGLAFHIAPSNVPVNFAYTLTAGLLAGNACVVKASSKDFHQTRIICNSFKRVLANHKTLKQYINVVMYERDRQDITEYYSSVCNVRVIWGGDRTIESVKSAPLPPRGIDIAFADRYSIAVVKADAVLSTASDDTDGKKIKTLAQDFYNDTYLYDQNACSSPRLMYWLGNKETVTEAKAIFWKAVYENIKDRYKVEPVIAVNKLTALDRTAIAIEGSKAEQTCDNKIVRIDIPCLVKEIPDLREAGGFFHEYTDTSLEALSDIVTEKYQTLAYFGCNREDLRAFVISHGLHGIDRIVPFGHTADFGLLWDGYDLILTMSRIIVTA